MYLDKLTFMVTECWYRYYTVFTFLNTIMLGIPLLWRSYTCVYSQWCFVPPAYKCNITDSYASSNRYMYMLNMSPNQKRVTIQIYSSSASNCLSHNNACSVANLLMYVWGWYSFYDRPIGLNYCVYLSKPSDMCISRHHKKA